MLFSFFSLLMIICVLKSQLFAPQPVSSSGLIHPVMSWFQVSDIPFQFKKKEKN